MIRLGLLLGLASPGVAGAASIDLPGTVSTGGDEILDLFVVPPASPPTGYPVETLDIKVSGMTLTSTGSCTFSVTTFGTKTLVSSSEIKYVFDDADPTGIWTITCGSETVDIQVVADVPHRRLWLDRHTAAELAEEFDDNKEVNTTGYRDRYDLGPQSGDGNEWIPKAGWYYLLQVAISGGNGYAKSSSGTAPQPYGGGTPPPRGSSPTTPSSPATRSRPRSCAWASPTSSRSSTSGTAIPTRGCATDSPSTSRPSRTGSSSSPPRTSSTPTGTA